MVTPHTWVDSEDNRNTFLTHMTTQPGVYRMLSDSQEILYVGKAYNLQKRLQSYFQKNNLARKTALLMSQVQRIEVTVTRTENEAFILENTLIKRHKPRYNVLLRDDKSYPYIVLDEKTEFPRLSLVRSKKKMEGRYFGPYSSVDAARETLHFLQKLFGIRQCSDPFFKHRKRPCLQYQIKRCSAPCVGFIEALPYQQALGHAVLFLQGKNNTIIDALAAQMQAASEALEYEKAAKLRDRIQLLHKTQQQQHVISGDDNCDVLGWATEGHQVCVSVLSIRQGELVNSQAYFPSVPEDTDAAEMIESFISQYYSSDVGQNLSLKLDILVPLPLKEVTWLRSFLLEQYQVEVHIRNPQRGVKLKWLAMARDNAKVALQQHTTHAKRLLEQFNALSALLDTPAEIERITCFDISHAGGEATVASCVVFDRQGACVRDYRRYHIKGIKAGDDYAALKQAVLRHFSHLVAQELPLPDLLLIDGGKGQLSSVHSVLSELALTDLVLLGIAKGEGRKPGLETLFLWGQTQGIHCREDAIALHLLQQVRDEAHRFAITGHRKLRDKRRVHSDLETIAGIGPKRRQRLLEHFGGWQELKRAHADDLMKVPGISPALAQRIYESLHT
ncbi:MAG: excinuclease ABC subunit UvrC [Gammaproteobacteria bacterium]|nr:excinuclease ABC subunit UvrC [Gammaproteobacteria bacterium]